MIKTSYKWVKRCLGWIILGGIVLGVLGSYLVSLKTGYGTVEIRLAWNDKAYPSEQVSAEASALRIGGKPYVWKPGNNLRLRPGQVKMDLQLKGFRVCSTTANVVKNSKAVAEFRLEAEPRRITIENLKSNSVVNGEPCGKVWVMKNAEVGKIYQVEALAPGYYPSTLTVKLETPGQDLVTNLVWRPYMAFVRLTMSPTLKETSVAFDGNWVDAAAGSWVEVGTRTLIVSNANCQPYSRIVEVLNGVTNSFLVALIQKPGQLAVEVKEASVRWELTESMGGPIAVQAGMAELPAGRNDLTISAKGYTPQRRVIMVEPNKKYSWQVELEREGAVAFKRAKTDFEDLMDKASGMVLLEKNAGREWKRIQDTKFDNDDLVRGANQYTRASLELTAAMENAEALEKYRTEYYKISADGIGTPDIIKYGGIDWDKIHKLNFDADTVAQQAQQYEIAYNGIKQILESLPARGEGWTNQARSSVNIDYWILLRDFPKAKSELAIYTERFGPGTDFDRWYGGVAGKIQNWRDTIDLKERYAPQEPGSDKANKKNP
ncbi:MAG: hypothetical protein WBN22_05940 [Verrucomicrobiia bacterium]